jgi:hypothetical protein
MEEKKIIVSIGVVKIKDFLFSANKSKVISGASYLLDYLNKVEVRQILLKNKVEKNDEIYVNAGEALFCVDTEEKAKKIIKEVKDLYAREAFGTKIVGEYIEKKEDEKIQTTLKKLKELGNIQKDNSLPILNYDFPCIEKCEINPTESAEIYFKNLEKDLKKLGFTIEGKELILKDKKDKISLEYLKQEIQSLAEKTGKVSEATLRKIIASNILKNENITKEKEVGFYQYLNKFNVDIDIEKNIDDFDNKNDFIGFMYSDGDSLGEFLEKVEVGDSEEYLKFKKKFSKALDNITKYSLAKTLKEVFKNVEKEKRWGKFLIVGGDDVCAIFDSTLVLEISSRFQKEFQERMKKRMDILTKYRKELKDVWITSSSGVVIAKKKTPMFQLFKQATILQKNAKEKRYSLNAEERNTGFIDFQIIGSEGRADINGFRKTVTKLIERPYAIEIKEKSSGIKKIGDLLNVIKEMKRIDFPTTKLRYIYELKKNSELEDFEKKMDFVNVLSKMDKRHIELIKKIMMDRDYEKFNESFNNIFDIIEIYNFVDEKIMDNKKDGVTNGN